LNDTNIGDLLKISSGDLGVLEKITEDFRQRIQEPLPKAMAASATSSAADAGPAAAPKKP